VVPADVQSHRVRVEVYPLDGLHQLETTLSAQLPNDSVAAQRVALQRIGQLDAHDRDTLRSAAVGLAKALQYGLDRYPATVINATAVVYGTTDVELALSRYRSWREERAR
jgi:integrating conjugative element protein (TIGR03757 family)